MNRIQKFLSRLDPKERSIAEMLLSKLIAMEFDGLDIKKLKGQDTLFRVRKGDLRIIYSIHNNKVNILDIGRRNDTTYNF